MTMIYIVDDDDAVRDSLGMLLESAGLTVESFPSALSALDRCKQKRPDCLLTDIRMPGMDGLALQRALTEAGIDVPVIMMTGHGEVPLAVAALKAGASDFIEKPVADDVILASIGDALGKSHDQIGTKQVNRALQERINLLTPREREVFNLLVAGDANKVIAYRLDISIRTVEIHRARVMDKMKARSLPELVRLAMALDLLQPS